MAIVVFLVATHLLPRISIITRTTNDINYIYINNNNNNNYYYNNNNNNYYNNKNKNI